MPRIFHFEKQLLTFKIESIVGRILLSSLVLACTLPVLYCAFRILRADRLVMAEKRIDTYSAALEYDPGNGELWWDRGRLRHYSISSSDVPAAARDYRQALSLNPRIGQAWVDLAACYELLGNIPKAEESLQEALRVWTYSPLIRWQAGNFYLLRGNLERMYECFKMACEYDISKLEIAIQTAWNADPDHSGIDRKLIPDNLPAKLLYFNYLVARGELDLARVTWERSLGSPIPGDFQYRVSIAFPYIDRLLTKSRIEDALRVWEEALNKAGLSSRFVPQGVDIHSAESAVNLIFNGSFEDEILRGGFDWRYPDPAEIEFRIDLTNPIEGLRSFRLAFGGTNINFRHLSQIVPIPTPGKYLFEYYVKTENLTTDQKPYFMLVSFPDAQDLNLRTRSFPASSAWRKYSIPFTVMADTKAVQVLLRRDPSEKFDNQINGSLWLDKVSIRPQIQQSGASGPGSE